MKKFLAFLSVIAVVLAVANAKAEANQRPETESEPAISKTKSERNDINEEKRQLLEAKRKARQEELDRQKQSAEQEQSAETQQEEEKEFYWGGEVITPSSGVANGPSGYETYYNLPMGGVVSIMRGLGYSEAEYPYWVRDDGCKMLGDYIMVAANLDLRPYGTVLPCSRGMAIVCDTGTFAASNPYQLDIAVSW